MVKIARILTIAILFFASVGFGQANSSSNSGASGAGLAAVISIGMGAMLYYQGKKEVAKGEGEIVDGTNKRIEGQDEIVEGKSLLASGNASGSAMVAKGKVTEEQGIQTYQSGDFTKTLGLVMIGMGILSGTQGLAQAATSIGASESESQSGYNGSDYAGKDFELSLPDGSTLNSNRLKDMLDSQKSELARMGGKLNENGLMTLPNGKTADLNDLSNGNAGAFAAATGLSPAQMEKLAGAIKDAGSKAAGLNGFNAKDMRVSMSSGGSSGGRDGDGAGSGSRFDFSKMFPNMKPKDRSAASFTGPAKNFRGQPIGVAQDNIFKMVSRRYQEKSKSNYFMVGN